MNLEQLLRQIEAAIVTLIGREPSYTGSFTLEVHFQDGKAKVIHKIKEKCVEHVVS